MLQCGIRFVHGVIEHRPFKIWKLHRVANRINGNDPRVYETRIRFEITGEARHYKILHFETDETWCCLQQDTELLYILAMEVSVQSLRE